MTLQRIQKKILEVTVWKILHVYKIIHLHFNIEARMVTIHQSLFLLAAQQELYAPIFLGMM